MTFLAILIVVFVYKNWLGSHPLQARLPFAAYQHWFLSRPYAPLVRYLLCVGLPVLLVASLAWLLSSGLTVILWLLLSLIVLFYTLDSVNLADQLEEQEAWLRSLQAGRPVAGAIEQQETFVTETTYFVFQSIYPVLFWFLLLGPTGALAYGLSRSYLQNLQIEDPEYARVERVVFWMEWLPVRVTGFIFALLGDFGRCFDTWVAAWSDTESSAEELLRALLGLAIDEADYTDVDDIPAFVVLASEDLQAVKVLLARTLFGWLGLAAVLAIVGW
jgi:AmpE protein